MNTTTTTTTTAAENFVLDNFTAVDFLAGDGRTILLNDISWNEYEMSSKILKRGLAGGSLTTGGNWKLCRL